MQGAEHIQNADRTEVKIMDSEKYKIYRDIFIEVKKYNEREYVAFAYGFDDLKSSSFETEECALNEIIKKVDIYIDECVSKKIIYRKPVPPDSKFLDSSRDRADIYRVTREECINLSESLFVKEPSFALSAVLNNKWVYKVDGSFFVNFSKFLREAKFVDANKYFVFAPLTKKIYDIYYTLNYLYGIFQIYVDSSGLLVVEYDRRKIDYGRVYELEYDVYGESKGRGYLVINRDGLFDNCEFKGFHNLMDDYQYSSNSAILEDYQVLSKLLPDSDFKISERVYKLAKFRMALLLRQAIETDMNLKCIDIFLKNAEHTFFYFLNQYVFKYEDFISYTYKDIKFDTYKLYFKEDKFIENEKIYKQNYEQDVLQAIVLSDCQNEREFEVLKMYLAGTECVGSRSENQFDALKLRVAIAAWEYVGKMSDKNEILSVIAIEKINGRNDLEIYDIVKDKENFIRIRNLLDIKSNKDALAHNDKFIKRIINDHVSKLADEHHIPKPKLRERTSK